MFRESNRLCLRTSLDWLQVQRLYAINKTLKEAIGVFPSEVIREHSLTMVIGMEGKAILLILKTLIYISFLFIS